MNSSNSCNVLEYQTETCRELSKWDNLQCVKVLSEKSLIQSLMTSLQIRIRFKNDVKVFHLNEGIHYLDRCICSIEKNPPFESKNKNKKFLE